MLFTALAQAYKLYICSQMYPYFFDSKERITSPVL